MEGKTLGMVVAMAGLVAIGVGMMVLYGGGPPPAPERPRPPPPSESLMNSSLKYSAPVYRALIEQNAKEFQVSPPTAAELAAPNPYFEELHRRTKVKPKDPIDTPHLRLALEVSKQKATVDGQSFTVEHLVLRIENKTAQYLAYRIQTDLPEAKKCSNKGDLAHNAIVIQPHETVLRTECLYRGSALLDVTHIEVIELPALSAFYVSRLPATATLYDPRTSGGHVPLKGTLCAQTFSWRDLREGIDRKEFGWRDVIDFYARHNCEEYSFFRAYRYRIDSSAPLPARPLD